MTAADDYTFELPEELIAQDPGPRRVDSRLLVGVRYGAVQGIGKFAEIADHLRPGDLLVGNDSRVLPARLWTRRRDTGGKIEVLLVRPTETPVGAWQAMARPARRLRAGQVLALVTPAGDALPGGDLVVHGRTDEGEVVLTTADGRDLLTIAEQFGEVPLPPYIHRDVADPQAAIRRTRDRQRYQTVYARTDQAGTRSVAAPTAGLHFDSALLDRLAARSIEFARVTLHVGPGTFQPPSPTQIAAGRLHPEAFELPATTVAAVRRCRRRRGRVIAVGTTSLRVLATVAGLGLPASASAGEVREFSVGAATDDVPVFTGRAVADGGDWSVRGTTRLFIQPPTVVDAADGLLTNFHLPGSSLLMLVAAFAGDELWRDAYATAVGARMRFFSYGDAMLLLPEGGGER